MAELDMKNNSQEEKELIEACISGDKKAWGQFVEKYSKLVYNCIYRTLEAKGWALDSNLVEDLYQEMFLIILKDDFEKLRRFGWKNNCSFATWLSVISKNLVLDFVRKESKRAGKTDSIDKEVDSESGATLLDTLKDKTENVAAKLSRESTIDLLKAVIEDFDENDKTLLDLLYYHEMPYEDIAELMGKSIDALYMQKKRLLDKLKDSFKKRVGS